MTSMNTIRDTMCRYESNRNSSPGRGGTVTIAFICLSRPQFDSPGTKLQPILFLARQVKLSFHTPDTFST